MGTVYDARQCVRLYLASSLRQFTNLSTVSRSARALCRRASRVVCTLIKARSLTEAIYNAEICAEMSEKSIDEILVTINDVWPPFCLSIVLVNISN